MKQLKISILYLILMTALLGLVYPFLMMGIAKSVFLSKSNGSLLKKDGQIVGSSLIGQNFNLSKYFHGRPSVSGYDALSSGGSNLGPINKKLIDQAALYADKIRKENNLSRVYRVPADLVLSSGSGLDPHISLDSALLQAGRVADARKIKPADVIGLIKKHTETQYFGGIGNAFVNVLELNMELDKL